MATGNSVASTLNQGVNATPEAISECKELADKNEERREELRVRTSNKTVIGVDRDGRGTTLSSGKFLQSGGRQEMVSAHNRHTAHEFCNETLTAGGDMEDRRKGKSSLDCGDPPYTHPKPACQKSGHAEARIMDYLGGRKKGVLTLSIDWRPTDSTKAFSKMPCESCHKMLCYAQQECKMEVYICDSKNRKHNLANYCPASSISYRKLKKALGESGS